jgi:hypothetical protein
MIPMTFNGVRVKSMIIELEDGSMIYKQAPAVHHNEPIVFDAPEEPALIEETVEPVVEEPTINDPPSNKKRGWRKPKKGTYLKVPLSECKGVACYTTAAGREMQVVIYKTGQTKGRNWYKLLYLSECTKFGQHPTGGFFGKEASLSAVNWFN